MNLEKILSIAGKPGLYKLVSQSRTALIVETLDGSKRFPAHQTMNVSSLKDIAIYTTTEEVPLKEVFGKIAEKENYSTAIDHKSSPDELRNYMLEILPDFDQDRVYHSDLKKVFSWYNLLLDNGLITPEAEEEEGETGAGEEE